MKLGIFLHRGGSLENLKKVGQDNRFINIYLKNYSKKFEKIYIFSYANESRKLPKNCVLVPNRYRIPNILYPFLIPLIHKEKIKECDIFRVFHISGTIPAVISKILYKKKYVTTYGYLWLKDLLFRKMYHQYFFAKLVEYFGLRLADGVIVTIDVTKNYVKKFTRGRIIKIPNSVDTNLFRPMKIKKGKIKRIIRTGRIEEAKNIPSLIKAVSLLKDKAELVMFCNINDLTKELTQLAKELGVKMKIHDIIPNEELPKELNKADVFVIPSFFEGHPKVLIEAMACGLPCIGTNVRGIKEVIRDGKTGLLCGTDPESIAEKIQWVFDHPKEAKKLGKNARKYVLENLSSDRLLSVEIDFIKDIAKN